VENDPVRFQEQEYDKEHFSSEPVIFDNQGFDLKAISDLYVVNPDEDQARMSTFS
jgi:hypothetical protein